MLRKALESIGKKLSEISLGYVYTAMGVLFAGGVLLFVDISQRTSISDFIYDPKTWAALAVGTLIYLVLGLGLQSVMLFAGRTLISASSWYPKWYYFPKISFAPALTPNDEIELTFTNPRRRQEFSLQAAYARLDTEVTARPSLAGGVAPISKKLLFPLADMPVGAERKRIVGKVENGVVHLVMGENSEETMELTEPGHYIYHISIYGRFRGRNYEGGTKFTLLIRRDGQVVIRE